MKLILKADVDNLGHVGDVVDVRDGYGNNFLMPRGLAMLATRGAVKDAQVMRQARGKRDERTAGDARDVAASLQARPVRVAAKAGEDGTLYGSVGNTVVVQAVRQQLGVTLDRRSVPMERPLKTVGTHQVLVKIHPQVTATLQVEVVPA